MRNKIDKRSEKNINDGTDGMNRASEVNERREFELESVCRRSLVIRFYSARFIYFTCFVHVDSYFLHDMFVSLNPNDFNCISWWLFVILKCLFHYYRRYPVVNRTEPVIKIPIFLSISVTTSISSRFIIVYLLVLQSEERKKNERRKKKEIGRNSFRNAIKSVGHFIRLRLDPCTLYGY